MINLHTQILQKEGKNEFVVIPYDEFLKLQEELDCYEDLRLLREAKEADKDQPTVGLEELRTRMQDESND